MTELLIPDGYIKWLADLKLRIGESQLRAVLSVNSELVRLYWDIGCEIQQRQTSQGWGAKIIDRLADDLRRAFPEMKGFSPTNLKYMRRFAEECPSCLIGQQPADQLPWFHIVVILTKLTAQQEREFYAVKAIEHGWSRNILSMQIEARLFHREGKAITNFEKRLPSPQSDFAQATLKDPYLFDFLGLSKDAAERDVERELVEHISRFLLELGAGFAFVGRQIRLSVGDDDFFLDLLFYHLKLRCYVVIELKATPFKPEYAGQLNFYLSAVDTQIKSAEDNPTIGILLCKGKNKLVAEYALRGLTQPIGVADYQLTNMLPHELEGSLPSIEELESALESESFQKDDAERDL